MPHRNRVDPWGGLVETPARGAWFGNRGCLHDAHGRLTGRKPPVDAWIICVLEFKGRRRKLLQPGRYTELFFLDEATALAAGHRPCGECRHDALRRFGVAWPAKEAMRPYALAREIDPILARERAAAGDPRRACIVGPNQRPPDGVFFSLADEGSEAAYVASSGALWRWTPAGYEGPVPWRGPRRARMLTPPSTSAAIANGYSVQIDRSALR